MRWLGELSCLHICQDLKIFVQQKQSRLRRPPQTIAHTHGFYSNMYFKMKLCARNRFLTIIVIFLFPALTHTHVQKNEEKSIIN